ncbi:MAG TPA: hypothetical protein VKE42_11575, partial [Candidatus Cybelea sp.]|nr:hypothetical protein [Candidatus Cybelea sp.]
MLRFAILTLGLRKSSSLDLRAYAPISGKPEIGVSFCSRKSARSTRPGHENARTRVFDRRLGAYADRRSVIFTMSNSAVFFVPAARCSRGFGLA